jgi:hypothetical protein
MLDMTPKPNVPDWDPISLRNEVKATAERTGDEKLVERCDQFIALVDPIAELLNAKESDPVRVLRESWRDLATNAKRVLSDVGTVHKESKARVLEIKAGTMKRINGRSKIQVPEKPSADAIKAATDFGEGPGGGNGGNFDDAGRHLKTLQDAASHAVDQSARRVDNITLTTESELLSSMQNHGTQLRNILRWLRLTRFLRAMIRATINVLTFIILFVGILYFHGPASAFVEKLGEGSIWAFVLLALIMLPVELIKAKFIERRLEEGFARRNGATHNENSSN